MSACVTMRAPGRTRPARCDGPRHGATNRGRHPPSGGDLGRTAGVSRAHAIAGARHPPYSSAMERDDDTEPGALAPSLTGARARLVAALVGTLVGLGAALQPNGDQDRKSVE